jgi:hypothetical protein
MLIYLSVGYSKYIDEVYSEGSGQVCESEN